MVGFISIVAKLNLSLIERLEEAKLPWIRFLSLAEEKNCLFLHDQLADSQIRTIFYYHKEKSIKVFSDSFNLHILRVSNVGYVAG